jgi:hypothetical protein
MCECDRGREVSRFGDGDFFVVRKLWRGFLRTQQKEVFRTPAKEVFSKPSITGFLRTQHNKFSQNPA